MIERAATQYYKNSPNILRSFQTVFESVEEYDKVVFMGLSCGDQDAEYAQEIVRHAHFIDFDYQGKTARKNLEYYVSDTDVDVTYIRW